MRPYHFDFERHRSRGPYARLDECSPCQMLAELIRMLPATLRQWNRRMRQRHELAGLDYRVLRDIGVTPSEVARELQKPFWRA
jgi:uncharacterized protein YjiS (DUF1127 family)